jgi:multidrug transporter EmrE-like cation transporter
MSLPQIFALSVVEIAGNFALKKFSNEGGIKNLSIGILGYIGVIYFLIMSLQGSTVLLVNIGWDGISAIIQTLAAYFILGERLESQIQYLGIVIIILGLFLIKIPWQKNKEFTFPQI